MARTVVSILLFEDLAIVPLLAFVALPSPNTGQQVGSRWLGVGVGLGAVLCTSGRAACLGCG